MTAIYKSPEGERAVRDRYLRFLERWPVPNERLHLPTREGETFVIASGPPDGPPLVLLHGGSFNSVTWMGDVATWVEHFRVYAVDVIGQPGLSAPSRPPYQSQAYVLWLDDVFRELELGAAALGGISLGGWIALDYAICRPANVSGLVLLCPGGVGRTKIGILRLLFVLILLKAFGDWGRRKAMVRTLGPVPGKATPATVAVRDFAALIFRHFRPNTSKLPRFSDPQLAQLTMPVLLIVGARDAMLDSEETRQRMENSVPNLEVRYLQEAGHVIVGQTQPILDFLGRVISGASGASAYTPSSQL